VTVIRHRVSPARNAWKKVLERSDVSETTLGRRRSPHGLRAGSFLLPFCDTIALTAGVTALAEALETEHALLRFSFARPSFVYGSSPSFLLPVRSFVYGSRPSWWTAEALEKSVVSFGRTASGAAFRATTSDGAPFAD